MATIYPQYAKQTYDVTSASNQYVFKYGVNPNYGLFAPKDNANGVFSNVADVSITNQTGTIEGGNGDGSGNAGIGIDLLQAATVTNDSGGTIMGGINYNGFVNNEVVKGNGGIGVSMVGGSLTNAQGGTIKGGMLFPSGTGNGGVGVSLTGGVLVNSGAINGGQGFEVSGAHGSGGDGLDLTGGVANNTASGKISGGVGLYSTGVGVNASGMGTQLVNLGTITGGSLYSNDFHGYAHDTGVGGAGVILSSGAKLTTYGSISGGSGDALLAGSGGDAVDFSPSNGELDVGSGANFHGNIGGFAIGDTVDMLNIAPADVLADFGVSGTLVGGNEEFAGSTTGETLATTQSQNEGTLKFSGNFNGETFVLSTDSAGTGTDITLQAACYQRGTHIRTARGEVPIEKLIVGDLVETESGAHSPVRWLGSRRIDCSRYPEPSLIWPILIRAGAIAEGRPLRDLWVSPGHSLFIDGVLIQAEKLVNGATIVQVRKSQVEYWHVELDRHDIVYAEGMPAESYLDTGNREAFANGGAFIEAYPDFKPKHWSETCVPLMQEGPALFSATVALLERCRALGYVLSDDAGVHLIADGERIAPLPLSDTVMFFSVPAGRQVIELCCRTFIPAQVDPGSADHRALGLCIRRLQIDGAEMALEDDQFFASGCHELENVAAGRHRWTRAQFSLPAGTRLVVIEQGGESHCWTMPRSSDEALRGLAAAV